jgi:flavin-dependent dehydrogenase
LFVRLATTDLCVIGGGPAGLAAAIAARTRGLEVVVVDHAKPPVDKVCGEGIMPDGVAAARALGIHLEEAGAWPFRGIRFCEDGVTAEAEFPVTLPQTCGFGVRRVELHRLVLRRAGDAGVRMIWGTRVSGIRSEGVDTESGFIGARWIAGADGSSSSVRRWAGLDVRARIEPRYGFRRHYRIAPWTESMELHWADGCQLYLTPVGESEICAVLLSRDSRLRLDAGLPRFPDAARRLLGAPIASAEHGAITMSRRLKSVCGGNVVLVGDASGSVDAITGEGLCLVFQQAVALADALAAGDLDRYEPAHERIGRRPRAMSSLMLLLDRHRGIRGRVLRAMSAAPHLFPHLLALHLGERSPLACASDGLILGWRMLTC